jgi:hypothetical protein
MNGEHFDRAKNRLHGGTNNEVTRAQVEATLALAYEQRTANLIALWIDPNANELPLNGLDYGGIAQQIKERLGLA